MTLLVHKYFDIRFVIKFSGGKVSRPEDNKEDIFVVF
jgi:hypothetical protein